MDLGGVTSAVAASTFIHRRHGHDGHHHHCQARGGWSCGGGGRGGEGERGRVVRLIGNE